jgi:hypothetical protein
MKNTTTNTWRDARALDPWAYPSPKPEFDVARLDVGFETIDEAMAERDLRVQHLRRAGSIEHRKLAHTLRSCAPEARCRSAACPICCRRLRRWFVGSVLETLGDTDAGHTTGVASSSWTQFEVPRAMRWSSPARCPPISSDLVAWLH